MKFLTDDEGLAINIAMIAAVKIKQNNHDGTFKNKLDYPVVADVHVLNREKPFTVYLTSRQKAELTGFLQGKITVETGGAS